MQRLIATILRRLGQCSMWFLTLTLQEQSMQHLLSLLYPLPYLTLLFVALERELKSNILTDANPRRP